MKTRDELVAMYERASVVSRNVLLCSSKGKRVWCESCSGNVFTHFVVDGIDFYRCNACKSVYVDEYVYTDNGVS